MQYIAYGRLNWPLNVHKNVQSPQYLKQIDLSSVACLYIYIYIYIYIYNGIRTISLLLLQMPQLVSQQADSKVRHVFCCVSFAIDYFGKLAKDVIGMADNVLAFDLIKWWQVRNHNYIQHRELWVYFMDSTAKAFINVYCHASWNGSYSWDRTRTRLNSDPPLTKEWRR